MIKLFAEDNNNFQFSFLLMNLLRNDFQVWKRSSLLAWYDAIVQRTGTTTLRCDWMILTTFERARLSQLSFLSVLSHLHQPRAQMFVIRKPTQ